MSSSHDNQADPLRALANRWALKARDHAREAKTNTDARLSAYHRGIAETFHKAAMELAEVLQNAPARVEAADAPAAPAESQTPAAAPQPEGPAYTAVPVKEVIMILDYAGMSPRDLTMRPDNVFTAVFSRWQPFSDEERLAKLRGADLRIVVLATGKLRDTSDPYVDFAFKEIG